MGEGGARERLEVIVYMMVEMVEVVEVVEVVEMVVKMEIIMYNCTCFVMMVMMKHICFDICI